MFFRFGSAIILAVLIASAGVMLETRSLELRRQVSRQHFRTAVLLERHAKLRLKTQQLGRPDRLFEVLKKQHLQLNSKTVGRRTTEQSSQESKSSMPLLRWRQATPFHEKRN